MLNKKYFIILFVMTNSLLLSKTITVPDTLETARQLSYNQNYTGAINLLESYSRKHPGDINAIRLHAQVLYWMKDYNSAFNLIELYFKKFGKQKDLLLDYSRMLFEQKRYSDSKLLLSEYLESNPGNPEANNMMGTIYYWMGKPEMSLDYFQKVLSIYPTNEWASGFVKEIKLASAPYIHLESGYSDDTQPLKAITTRFSAGWNISSWLTPGIKLKEYIFNPGESGVNSFEIQVKNKFAFPALLLDASISAGIFGNHNGNKSKLIGSIGLSKNISEEIKLSLAASRMPYQYTKSSLQKSIIQDDYTAALIYDKAGGWNVKAGYSYKNFKGRNNIQSAFVWLLSPGIKVSSFIFKIGYAFNYSDSKNNLFNSVDPIEEIVAKFDSTVSIAGEYNPYFTPANRKIHSILGNFTFSPVELLRVNVNLKAGVYAKADNPYLYLDSSNGDVLIRRGFTIEDYTPVEVTTSLDLRLSGKLTAEFKYTYVQTIFFNSNYAQIGIRYIFLDD